MKLILKNSGLVFKRQAAVQNLSFSDCDYTQGNLSTNGSIHSATNANEGRWFVWELSSEQLNAIKGKDLYVNINVRTTSSLAIPFLTTVKAGDTKENHFAEIPSGSTAFEGVIEKSVSIPADASAVYICTYTGVAAYPVSKSDALATTSMQESSMYYVE